MAAVTPAVSNALASAYAPDSAWLTQDTTNPTGKGPVATGPTEAISNPVNATAPVELNPPGAWQAPPEQAPDYFAESLFPHAGPWPPLPAEGQGKEPFGTLPPDGITPAGSYKVPPKITGLAQTKALLPGHDAQAQVTDTAGWDQYLPSGRTAVRQGWLQNYPGVQNWWPITQPNLARTRTALGGDQEISGVVAQYGDLASSGGNTAYEAPEPPAVSTQQAASEASTIPQWGF